MKKLRYFLLVVVLLVITSLNSNLAYASSINNVNKNDISCSTFIKDIAYGKGKYVIVGQNGLIQTSTDGIDWKGINSNTKNNIYKIIFANDHFIAIGEKGIILTSGNGEKWTKNIINNKVDFYSLGYIGTQYVAADNYHRIYVSKDLNLWENVNLDTKYNSILPETTHRIAQNGKKIVLLDGGAILTSKDGLNWNKVNCNYGASIEVAYVKDRFIVRTLWEKIITSKDGINWKEFDETDEKELEVKTYEGYATKTKIIIDKDIYVSILQRPSGDNKIKFYNYINGKVFAFNKPGNISVSEDCTKWEDVKLSIYDNSDLVENNESQKEDNKKLNVKEFKDINTGDKNRVFHAKFNQNIDLDACKDYVVVARDGLGRHPVAGVNITMGTQKNTIDINPPKDGFEEGCYYIIIKPGLNSIENNKQKIKRMCRMKFTVKNFSEEENTMYNVIKNSLLAVDEKVNIKDCVDFDFDKSIVVIDQVVKDNPLILYYDGADVDQRGEIVWQYSKDRKSCIQDMEKVKKKTDAIISELIKPEMDDYEKEKVIHDYIVMHCRYDYKQVGSHIETHSAYGVLINGLGICEGYSEAMQYVMQKLYIDCRRVRGQGHAWNIIKINGKWYQLDVTYDDPFDDDSDKVRHKYFNITDEEMRKNHIYSNDYPPCTSTEDNYYYREDSSEAEELF